MKIFEIEVTQEDIDNGKPESTRGCPIAYSLRRVFDKDFSVVGQVAAGVVEGKPVILKLPYTARTFVKDFDNKKAVKPFKFVVELS